MGRRAADLTTPVPVLGVPASVGVRSWKTTGGDRSGEALLQTWGQCTIGIQTSPGISRPPVQLLDSLSNNVTQTSNSCITKETKAVSLPTKNDNEKRNVLRQKTEETKIKKEVTFKALGGVASKDVASCQKSSGGTYCYARAIKTNPLIAGTGCSSRPRLKPSTRYINGSVVDSEAIGGISEVTENTEKAKATTPHGRVPQHLYADQSEKTLPLSLATVQKICNHCIGKQSVPSRGVILDEDSPISDTIFGEKPSKSALTSLFTATHLQLPHTLKQNQANAQSSKVKKTQIAGNPHLLYLNEEIRYRRTPHPACPVHSRGSLATLFQAHASSDVTSVKPETILRTKTVTITKARIESREENSTINCFTNPMQENKIPLLGSLSSLPQMATAIKTFQTSPKRHGISSRKSLQENIPQNVCVSVHAAPESPSSSLYTVAMGTQKTSSTVTQKTFNLEKMHINVSAPQETQETLDSKHKGQILNSKPPSNLTLVSSPPDLHKCQEKSPSPAANISPAKMSFIDNAAQFLASANPAKKTAPHSLLRTAVPNFSLNYRVNPDQITCRSSTDKAETPQIRSGQTNSSNSEPALNISASSTHAISGISKAPDSRGESPAALRSKIASHFTPYKNTTHRSIKTELKKATSLPGSVLSPLREIQDNVAQSRTCLLRLTEKTAVLRNNEVHDKNTAYHTPAQDIKSHNSDKKYGWSAIPNQQSNSVTAPLTSSKSQNMSETINRGTDAKSHHTNPTMRSPVELQCDKNKFRDNLINELVVHQSKEHGKCSRVTNPQNCFSPIKSSTYHLQGSLNREQQRLNHYQGYIQTDHKGHSATSPPGQTARRSHLNAQQFAPGSDARPANSKSESNADGQRHPGYSSPSAATQTNCEPTFSQTNTQVKPISQSTGCQNSNFDITLRSQTRIGSKRSVSVPASLTGEGGLPGRTGPELHFILQPSAMLSESSPPLQSKEVEAIRADLKFSPAAPQSGPGGTRLSHSHPSNTALLLPPSPQCSRSAGLEQRLKTVEASLATNKDRITTLLNIIQDLETCSNPNSLRRCKSGLDLKNCSTCQKTACIVYSVEYDFRQQERHFLEVLNHSPGDSNSFPAHLAEPLNLSLLRHVVFKKFTKTKLKSKKLCKTLLKWIPRKIHQL